MQVFDSSLDELRGQFTVAGVLSFEAGVDALELNRRFGQTLPAGVGRGYPNFNLIGFSFDGQNPMGGETPNVSIVDYSLTERVDDGQFSFTKNDFWFDPNQENRDAQQDHNRKIDKKIVDAGWVENALHHVDCQKQVSQTRPSNVGLWAKSLMHSPIITGDLDSQREASND